jgi:hypothetical protein
MRAPHLFELLFPKYCQIAVVVSACIELSHDLQHPRSPAAVNAHKCNLALYGLPWVSTPKGLEYWDEQDEMDFHPPKERIEIVGGIVTEVSGLCVCVRGDCLVDEGSVCGGGGGGD